MVDENETAVLVIRVIRSFPHRNIKNIVLKSVPLNATGIIFRIKYRGHFSFLKRCSSRHRDILHRKVSQGKFSNWIRGRRGAGFFLIGTIYYLSLKRRRDLDFINSFVIMEGRDKPI